jgi:hypothetical protein
MIHMPVSGSFRKNDDKTIWRIDENDYKVAQTGRQGIHLEMPV